MPAHSNIPPVDVSLMEPQVTPAAEHYASLHATPPGAAVAAVRQRPQADTPVAQMLGGTKESRLLGVLAVAGGARRILEIGTFTGATPLALAEVGAHDGGRAAAGLGGPGRVPAVTTDVVAGPPREVLVIVEPDRRGAAALEEALAIAVEHRSRLTLLAIVRRPSSLVALSGVCPVAMAVEAEREAEAALRRAVARVPQDVSVRTMIRHGRYGRQLRAVLRTWPFDLVCSGSPAATLPA